MTYAVAASGQVNGCSSRGYVLHRGGASGNAQHPSPYATSTRGKHDAAMRLIVSKIIVPATLLSSAAV